MLSSDHQYLQPLLPGHDEFSLSEMYHKTASHSFWVVSAGFIT